MCDRRGAIVRSKAGRDKGTLLYVLDCEGEFLFLADGKRRSARHPKRKKPGHVEVIDPSWSGSDVTEKLRHSLPVSDRELRRALAAFKGENELGKR